MIVIGVILSLVGLGALCGLLFTFATVAFPVFVAISAGMWLHTNGAGNFGAILFAALAGLATLCIGQFVFVTSRWTWLRVFVGTAFVIPAVLAGYYAALGLTDLFLLSEPWRIGFGVAGAAAVGMSALGRLSTFGPAAPARP